MRSVAFVDVERQSVKCWLVARLGKKKKRTVPRAQANAARVDGEAMMGGRGWSGGVAYSVARSASGCLTGQRYLKSYAESLGASSGGGVISRGAYIVKKLYQGPQPSIKGRSIAACVMSMGMLRAWESTQHVGAWPCSERWSMIEPKANI
jgi:hypothetical protein